MPTFVKAATPAKAPAAKNAAARPDLRSVQVKPAPVIAAGVVIAAAMCWFLWLGPKVETDNTVKNWATPAAAAARSPENRPKDAKHEAVVQQLRQKEGAAGVPHRSRRDE